MAPRICVSMSVFVFAVGCWAGGGNLVWGLPQNQEHESAAEATESSDGVPTQGIIDFARDVSPILADKCLECHGPQEAKNDFRVDVATSLLDYIEPGDAEGSSLWTDYLTSDDEDMRMPPVTVEQERRLTAAELATIKLWIDEGGMWNLVGEGTTVPEEFPPASMAARVWHFQGLFHPAAVHFPIALLTVSTFFVLLSFVRPATCEPVAFHCLWIGAMGSVVASASGWAYAVHEGYGPSFSFDLFNSAIDRHRWLGIAVSILAVALIPIAIYVRRRKDFGMRLMWLLGSLLMLAGVSITGFQGGELTYGEGHYEQEFIRLFPEALTELEPAVEDAKPEEAIEADVSSSELDPSSTTSATQPDHLTNEAGPDVNLESQEMDEDAQAGNAVVTVESDDSTASASEPSATETDASGQAAEQSSQQNADKNGGLQIDEASRPPPVVQPPALGTDDLGE